MEESSVREPEARSLPGQGPDMQEATSSTEIRAPNFLPLRADPPVLEPARSWDGECSDSGHCNPELLPCRL